MTTKTTTIIASIAMLAMTGMVTAQYSNTGSDVPTYNGEPRSFYSYTGDEPDVFEQWREGQISTSDFQTDTSQGEGTAALALEISTAPVPFASASFERFTDRLSEHPNDNMGQIEINSNKITMDTGNAGFCGRTGYRVNPSDEEIKAVRFEAEASRDRYAGTPGLLVNGEFADTFTVESQPNRKTWERDKYTVVTSDTDVETVGFGVQDTSSQYCDVGDHELTLDVYNMSLIVGQTEESTSENTYSEVLEEDESIAEEIGQSDGDDRLVLRKVDTSGLQTNQETAYLREPGDSTKPVPIGTSRDVILVENTPNDDEHVKVCSGRPDTDVASVVVSTEKSNVDGACPGPAPVGQSSQKPNDPDRDIAFEDVNGDGNVDLGDLEVFKANRQSLVSSSPEPLFYDFNGDGQISQSDETALKFEASSVLDQYDTDDSDSIEIDELAEAGSDYDSGQITRAELGTVIDAYSSQLNDVDAGVVGQYDNNDDMKISFDELRQAVKDYNNGNIDSSELAQVTKAYNSPEVFSGSPSPGNPPSGMSNVEFEIPGGWSLVSAPDGVSSLKSTIESSCSVGTSGRTVWRARADVGGYAEPGPIRSTGGYWLNLESSCSFTTLADTDEDVSYTEFEESGYYMVSVPNATSLDSVAGSCSFEQPNAYSGPVLELNGNEYQGLSSSTELSPTKGYWVKIQGPCKMGASVESPPSGPQ